MNKGKYGMNVLFLLLNETGIREVIILRDKMIEGIEKSPRMLIRMKIKKIRTNKGLKLMNNKRKKIGIKRSLRLISNRKKMIRINKGLS